MQVEVAKTAHLLYKLETSEVTSMKQLLVSLFLDFSMQHILIEMSLFLDF